MQHRKPMTDFGVGADSVDQYQSKLSGRRIGLIVNQASLIRGVHTIEFLRDRHFNIVKLFALEHGVRGNGGAGESIPDSVDPQSGLPIFSLYGKTQKPSRESLADVDVLVFDIQDVGVRFYTYISSLGLIMESAAEFHVPLIVMDRPNPNGDYIEGPILHLENKSFVGMFPIPLVYGLTIGELARMIHGEHWMKTEGLMLDVIPMMGYSRNHPEMPEGQPSSGLKHAAALRAYPSLGLFEPTIISVGKGTPYPYEQYGIPDVQLGNDSFTPELSDKHPLYEGKVCYGESFSARESANIPHFTTDLFTRALAKVQRRPFVTDPAFLIQLVGDKNVVDRMLKGDPYAEIRKDFVEELEAFKRRRRRYFLYPSENEELPALVAGSSAAVRPSLASKF